MFLSALTSVFGLGSEYKSDRWTHLQNLKLTDQRANTLRVLHSQATAIALILVSAAGQCWIACRLSCQVSQNASLLPPTSFATLARGRPLEWPLLYGTVIQCDLVRGMVAKLDASLQGLIEDVAAGLRTGSAVTLQPVSGDVVPCTDVD